MSEVQNCSLFEKPNDEGICKIDLKNPFLIIIFVTFAVIGVIILAAIVVRLARKPMPKTVVYVAPDTRYVTPSDTSGIIDSASAVPMPGRAVRGLRAAPPGTSSHRINQVGMPHGEFIPDASSRSGMIALSINQPPPPPPPPPLQPTQLIGRGTTGMTLDRLTGKFDQAIDAVPVYQDTPQCLAGVGVSPELLASMQTGYSRALAAQPPNVQTISDPRGQLLAQIRTNRLSY